ncbi:tumor necrosis factor receptor superfamily member 6-like isoform X1 [Petromyzon marinus]|uniref:tumor necrosis factor receptor superfamily member 6-like isoform X1 n=1 Tax=Petromyzon marinus TaxID=7757 RepID=UPI003F6F12BF
MENGSRLNPRHDHCGRNETRRGVAVTLLVRSALLSLLLATLPVYSQGCGSRQYRSKGGFCCKLCPAGRFLEEECHSQGSASFCDACPGGFYTAIENYSEKCFKCKPCELDEVEESPCSASSDRVCRCMPDFYKREGEHFCRPQAPTATADSQASDGPTLPIAIGCAVVGCLLVAAVACYVLIRKFRRRANPENYGIPMEVTSNISKSSRDNIVNNQAQLEPLIHTSVCSNGTVLVQPTDYSRYNKPITEEDLVEIHKARANSSAVAFVNVMRNAGLSEINIERIQHDHKNNVEEQNHKMLSEWLQVMGRKATFAALLKAMDECRFHKLSEDCQDKFDEIIKRKGLQKSDKNYDDKDGQTGEVYCTE